MTSERTHHYAETADDGRELASAEVSVVGEDGARTVRATVHVEPGHKPPGTGAGLVDAVLDGPEAEQARAIRVAVPRGEAVPIERLHQRLPEATSRQAGSTVFVEGDLPSAGG